MRVTLSILGLTLLAGCATTGPVVTPRISGGNEADGIVTLSSTRFLYNPVEPDWKEAAVTADKRCHGWGHDGPAYFAGDQEACEIYDFHGRCARAVVTRFYDCSG